MRRLIALVGLALLLNACSSAPQAPTGVKVGKPYTVGGQTYYPEYDRHYDKIGMASWYGPGFHGGKTANGERFDQDELTAAHPTLPMPSLVRVTNLSNGKSAIVRINDRGPFKDNRLIDLSRGSARALGITGLQRVRVEYLPQETEQYWAKMDLNTDDIQFAKNDPYAPKAGGEPADNEPDEPDNSVVAEEIAPQVKSAAPITSVAAADLKPENMKIRPLKPHFRVVNDAQAQESSAPVKDVEVQSLSENSDSKHDSDEHPQPKVVDLLDRSGKPVGASSTIKVVHMDVPHEDHQEAAARDAPEKKEMQHAAAKLSPATGGGGGHWFVQAGSFASGDNAQKLAGKLKKLAGVEVREVQAGGKTWHRVRVGPFGNKDDAEQALQQAVSNGAAGARVVQD